MNLKKATARGIFWSITQQWGRQIINLIVIAILSRLVDPVEFGLIALSTSFISFTKVLVDQGFSSAIIQIKHLDERHLNAAFWTTITLSIILFGVGNIFSDQIAIVFNNPALSPIIKVMSIQIVIAGLVSTQVAFISRQLKFKVLTIRSLASVFVGGIIGVIMAVQGYGVWALVGKAIGGSLTDVIVLWSASDWRPKLKFSISHFKELFSFGSKIVGSRIVQRIRDNIDNIIIGYFLGPAALGYYSIGYKVVEILNTLIIGIFRSVLLPVFSRIQSNYQRLRIAVMDVSEIGSLLFIPACLVIMIFAEPMIIFAFGPKWIQSVPVLQWLAVIIFTKALFTVNNSVLTAVNQPTWVLKLNSLDLIISIIGMLLGIQFGIVGIAAGRVIAGVIVLPMSYIIIKNIIGLSMKEFIFKFRPAIVGTGIMSLFLISMQFFFLEGKAFLQHAIVFLIGGGLYALYLFLFERVLLTKFFNFIFLVLPNKSTDN